MKNLPFAFLACFFFSIALGQSKDLETIKKINLDWINSYPTKDTMALSKIFSDDIVFINTSGIKLKKHEILKRIMEPTRQYVSAKIDSLTEARIIGNTGIIIGNTTFVRKLDGVESVLKSSYMCVYEKRKGKWLMVASHNTLLNAN